MDVKRFKPGDVVVLKSGGPPMTVKGYEPLESADVTCIWFSPKNGLEEKSFQQDLLDGDEETNMDDIYNAFGRK